MGQGSGNHKGRGTILSLKEKGRRCFWNLGRSRAIRLVLQPLVQGFSHPQTMTRQRRNQGNKYPGLSPPALGSPAGASHWLNSDQSPRASSNHLVEVSLAGLGWRRTALEWCIGEYAVYTPLFTMRRNLPSTVLSWGSQ